MKLNGYKKTMIMPKEIKAKCLKILIINRKSGEILDERGRQRSRNRPQPDLLQKILSFIGHFENISCLFVFLFWFHSRRVYLQFT
jgi:hypothetical protein